MRCLQYLALAAALLLSGAAPSQPHAVLAATPISRMDLAWWRQRHEAKLEELRSRRVDLIFLGDSITQDYERQRPAGMARFRAGLAALLRRPQRGQSRLHRRRDRTPAVADRERRGRGHRAQGRRRPDRRQQSRPAALVGRGHAWPASTPSCSNCDIACRRPSCCCWACSRRTAAPGSPRRTATINNALAARYRNGGEVTYLDIGHVFMQRRPAERRPVLRPEADAAGAAAASHARKARR